MFLDVFQLVRIDVSLCLDLGALASPQLPTYHCRVNQDVCRGNAQENVGLWRCWGRILVFLIHNFGPCFCDGCAGGASFGKLSFGWYLSPPMIDRQRIAVIQTTFESLKKHMEELPITDDTSVLQT